MKKMIGMLGVGVFFCAALSTAHSSNVMQVREKPACKKGKSQTQDRPETWGEDQESVDFVCDQSELQPQGQYQSQQQNLRQNNGFFVFGLGEVTFGKQKTTGPTDFVSTESQLVKEARAALFLQGKTESGYQITAMVDSGENEIKDIFRKLDEKNTTSLFTRLDDRRSYQVYGDGSSIEELAPTQGKLYAKLQKDKSSVMWGSFNTALNLGQTSEINRSLYGAKAQHESQTQTSWGQSKTSATVFVADPGTVPVRDEYRGTGGSVYFLTNQDITIGSEKIRIEVRDQTTGWVKQIKTLTYGQDYQVDYLQGRILLNEPLSAWSGVQSNVISQAQNEYGDPAFLVVDYELTPISTSLSDHYLAGGRAQTWLDDQVQIGTSVQKQSFKTVQDNTLKSVDATWRKSDRTRATIVLSQTEGSSTQSNQSINGGYQATTAAGVSGLDARAVNLELNADLRDFTASSSAVKVGGYYRNIDAGFSGSGYATNNDVKQYGTVLRVGEGLGLTMDVKADVALSKPIGQAETKKKMVESQLNYEQAQWFGSMGLGREESEASSNIQTTSTLAARVGKKLDQNNRVYVFGQNTLNTEGGAQDNDRVGFGAELKVSDKVGVVGEIARNAYNHNSANVRANYQYDDKTRYYTGYQLTSNTSSNTLNSGANSGQLTVGGNQEVKEGINAYAEEVLYHGNQNNGRTHAAGMDVKATDQISVGFGVELGQVNDLDRQAGSLKLVYHTDQHQGSVVYEHRREHSDTTLEARQVNVVKAKNMTVLDESFSLLMSLNRAYSHTNNTTVGDGQFKEVMVGLAYRPVDNDALNLLGKLTWLDDLSTDPQIKNDSSNQYQQRVKLASIDMVYELNRWWSLGGKYAVKVGEVNLGDQWVGTKTDLIIARVDYHITKQWDALLERRVQRQRESDTSQAGFLGGLFYKFNKNIKVGAGYNWSHFDDDLTTIDQDSKGWFINIVSVF